MKFTVDFVTQISQIDEKHWQETFASANPFIQYHYLLSLETSQCVSSVTGWQPMHVKVCLDGEPAEQQPVALMPLYLKSHSYGEYMFDWSWAEAYKNHGIDYYPKLISAVPFSPVSGTRLAVAKLYTNYRSEILHSITSALTVLADNLSVSNIQCLFHQHSDRKMFDTCNTLILEEGLGTISSSANNQAKWYTREDVQFHWFNKGYTSFDDFLSHLNSRKRKAIRKERSKVANQGIHFEKISGSELRPEHWQQFIEFYQMTYLKRSGHLGYLNLDCFQRWSKGLSEQMTLVIANKKQDNVNGTINNEVIAAALFFHDQDNLYGRYWGCLEEYDFLHFEACYYQGIELAIEKGLSCFNAGAQGEHKVARGFEPVVTHGSYLFTSTVFQEAIVDFLARERRYNQAYRIDIATKLPFKQLNE